MVAEGAFAHFARGFFWSNRRFSDFHLALGLQGLSLIKCWTVKHCKVLVRVAWAQRLARSWNIFDNDCHIEKSLLICSPEVDYRLLEYSLLNSEVGFFSRLKNVLAHPAVEDRRDVVAHGALSFGHGVPALRLLIKDHSILKVQILVLFAFFDDVVNIAIPLCNNLFLQNHRVGVFSGLPFLQRAHGCDQL